MLKRCYLSGVPMLAPVLHSSPVPIFQGTVLHSVLDSRCSEDVRLVRNALTGIDISRDRPVAQALLVLLL